MMGVDEKARLSSPAPLLPKLNDPIKEVCQPGKITLSLVTAPLALLL
jgi:hypothetical protein